MTADTITRPLLARIHIGKKELGWDDDTYRDALHKVAGVRSAKHLTIIGAAQVLVYMERCGIPPHQTNPHRAAKPDPARARQRPIDKIEAQLTSLGYGWPYAHGMAKKMFGVERVQWCTPDQLRRIVAALVYHQRRKGVALGPKDRKTEGTQP